MITPIRARYKSVEELAKNLGFDMYKKSGTYFVLCDWYLDVCRMFDANPIGDEEAIAWMNEQRPSPQIAPKSE